MEQKQPSAYQQGEWSKRFDKLPHHYEPIPNSKGGITPYVERKATLKFISQALQQTREDTIKECIDEIKNNYSKDGQPALVIIENRECDGGMTQKPALEEIINKLNKLNEIINK